MHACRHRRRGTRQTVPGRQRLVASEQQQSRLRVARKTVPIVLLLGGVGAIVAGAQFHDQPVLAQIEGKEPAGAVQQPIWMQHGAAAAKQYVATWLQEAEPQLIKEVTVGGVRLAEGWQIHRTYKGLEIPLLCPT